MAQTIDIKKAEKQVLRLSTFEDGIWEIYLGLFFILMGIYPVTRELLGPALNAILIIGVSLLLVTIAMSAKKRMARTRTGLVKLGPESKKKIKVAHIVIWSLVFATLTLAILGANSLLKEPTWEFLPQWLSDFDVDLVFALIMVGIFWVIAYSTGTNRFYLHGVLLGTGNFATTVLLAYNKIRFGWPIALAGLIIAGIGVSVLVRFLQEHPLQTEETPDGH